MREAHELPSSETSWSEGTECKFDATGVEMDGSGDDHSLQGYHCNGRYLSVPQSYKKKRVTAIWNKRSEDAVSEACNRT